MSAQVSPVSYTPIEVTTDKHVTENDLVSAVNVAVAESIQKNMDYCDSVAKSQREFITQALNSVEARIAETSRNKAVCMHVKVNSAPVVALKQEAHPNLAEVITIMQSLSAHERNVWLYGPAGTGKSTLVKQFSESLQLPVCMIAATLGTPRGDLIGRLNPLTGEYMPSRLVNTWLNGGVIDIEEASMLPPDVVGVILNALALGFLEIEIADDQRKYIPRHPNCYVFATDNTTGMGGDAAFTARERQDAAFLSRFCALKVDYSEHVDAACCPNAKLREYFQAVRKKALEQRIREAVDPRMMRYAYQMLQAQVPVNRVYESITARWSDNAIEQTEFTLSSFKEVAVQ
jgi:MoxR-like ATPase